MISRQLKTNSESQNVLARCEETHLILEGRKKKKNTEYKIQVAKGRLAPEKIGCSNLEAYYPELGL